MSIRLEKLTGILFVAGLLAGITIASAAVGQDALPVPPSREVTGNSPRERGTTGSGPAWTEDADRVEEGLEGLTPPGEYMDALRTTGMWKHLEERGIEQGMKSTTSWSLVGPVGGFGSPDMNGRIAGLELISYGGGSYYVFAGSCQGGLWRMWSSSWGAWTDIGSNLPNPSVRAFAVSPVNVNRIIVGTGDHRRYTGAGMFQTVNGGLTWQQVTMPAGLGTPAFFYRVKFLGTDTSGNVRLVAVSDLGPIYSANDGASWTRGKNPAGFNLFGPWTDLVQHPTDPKTLYAVVSDGTTSGNSGVYTSTNWGTNWTPLSTTGLPASQDWDRASLAICRDAPANLAVVIEDGNALRGVFKSVNGGASWSNITNELITTTPAYSFGGNQIWHAQAISFDPTDADHIFVGGVGLAESTDGGASWDIGFDEHGIEKGHADITQLHFDPITGDNALWICNDGGIYWNNRTTNLTYDVIGNSVSGLACSEIDYMDAERNAIGIGLQDNGTLLSMDAGLSWEFIQGGDGADISIFDPVDGDIFYNAGVYSPAPSWRTFRRFNGGPSTFTNNLAQYMPTLFTNPRNGRVYTHAAGGLLSLSASGTLLWVLDYATWRTEPFRTRDIFGAYGRDDSFWVNYWTDSTSTSQGDEDLSYIYKQGGTWQTKYWQDFNPSGDDVRTVTPSREWPDEAWVGLLGFSGSAKIIHVRDGGDIQDDITGTLSSVAEIRTIEVKPFDPETIWVGTDLGVFWTTDGGDTWDPFQDGLPIGRCTQLEFVENPAHGTTHKLLLAIDGRGVWSRDVVMPPVIYVDEDVAASGDGTRFAPYKTVTEGIAAAPSGAIVAVHTDVYDEPQTVSKNVKIVTWGGETTIR